MIWCQTITSIKHCLVVVLFIGLLTENKEEEILLEERDDVRRMT